MSEDAPTSTRIAVIYYSATGTVHRLAQAVAEGAENVGAEIRLRAVPELFPEMVISQNQHWGKHRSETQDAPEAELDDLGWADGFAFGTPTRFGNVAAQLKLFMDQAGGLWERGELVIAHPTDALHDSGALVALGAPALFLAGLMACAARIGQAQSIPRAVVLIALLSAIPLAGGADGLVALGVLTAMLAALVVAEQLRGAS